MEITLTQMKESFVLFMCVVWKHLNIEPTKAQYEIARWLQYGPKRRTVHAFRGVGKSWITSAYVLWRLLKNPQIKIMVVSASKPRSDAFSIFTKRLINELPCLQHLKPRTDQRQSNVAFDVAPAEPAQAPSVKSVGIFGQMTGSRADLIINDDIEVLNNSSTQDQREKILNAQADEESILKPDGEIINLGTPQTADSIYKGMHEKGYIPKYWPARVPPSESLEVYRDCLADSILEMIADGVPVGTPTDPLRFTDIDLREREMSIGKSSFQLQFMLNTELSDLDKYPLKTSDCLVMPLDLKIAPLSVMSGKLSECVLKDISNVGMSGDRWYKPFKIDKDYKEYSGKLMAIDPSGRGKDETTYAIVNHLHGNLYCLEVGGFAGGYEDETLIELAKTAKKFGVNQILIESNFGDGMFNRLFTPVLNTYHKCKVDEVRQSIQKEKRIIDSLEPLLNQHRLIFDLEFVRKDVARALDYSINPRTGHKECSYSLFHQLTRMTNMRNALKHDDALDVLAMACKHWTDFLAQDDQKQASKVKDMLLEETLKGFVRQCRGDNLNFRTRSTLAKNRGKKRKHNYLTYN